MKLLVVFSPLLVAIPAIFCCNNLHFWLFTSKVSHCLHFEQKNFIIMVFSGTQNRNHKTGYHEFKIILAMVYTLLFCFNSPEVNFAKNACWGRLPNPY